MMITKTLLLSILLLLLVACSDDKPEERDRPPNYGVYKQQMDSLEKTKDLERQLQQNVKTRDQQMRDMGG